MKHIIIYDTNTKEVKRAMSVTKEVDIAIQCEDGQSWIYGKLDDAPSRFVIEDGILTRKPEEDILQQELPEAWAKLRKKRDFLLSSSDWTQVPDAPVNQASWAIYRQELRDLPANTNDPYNPIWPTKPE